MANAPVSHTFIVTLLTLVSLLLVAGITYVYTNRNKIITTIFTVGAIATIALIRVISAVDVQIHRSFISGLNDDQTTYAISTTGWQQLRYAWHIWLLPVIFVIIIMGILFYIFWHYQRGIKTEILTAPALAKAQAIPEMRGDRLNHFMVIEAAKKETAKANQKLAQALLTNATYEIRLSDLSLQVEELTSNSKEKAQSAKRSQDILNVEMQAKQKENDYLLQQLAQRNEEIHRLEKLLEDLLDEEEGK